MTEGSALAFTRVMCRSIYKMRSSSRKSVKAFLVDASGAVTVEFVIILPMLLGLLLLIVAVSLLFSAASDVQQLAHELARAGIWHFSTMSTNVADACAALQAASLSQIVESLPNLSAASVRDVTCALDDDMLRVQVTYDLSQNFGQMLGRLIGMNIDAFVRSSAVRL
jgi:hypothetical protein